MLPFLLLPLLLFADFVSASQYLNTDGGLLHNSAVYQPQRRLTSDAFPSVNSNVTFITRYSKPKTTGLTDLVAWDRYSLYVKGRRLFVYSGEFHPFRLPSPDLWFDIIQKAKAAGNNAISIYVAWNQLNPSEGVLDMTGYRDLQPFFDMCKMAGVWVIARPGPFVNAETTGGGIPGWVIRKKGDMRTNSTDYFNSWQLYVDGVTQVIAKNQITEGGPVILVQVENEFTTGTFYSPHMEELKSAFRRNGIVVPLTFNNPTGKGNFASGEGAVDIAGLDAYPAGFTCRGSSYFAPFVTTFPFWSERVDRDAPYYFAEIQGGSFDPWGNATLGYESCRNMTDERFERVQTQYLLENRVTMVNKYMWYGGTNWGGIAAPVVYTSYDYGTYVREDRRLTTKYSQYKLLGLFLRNTPAIRQTEVVGYFGEFSQYSLKTQPYIGRPVRNGTFYTSDAGLWTTELRDPDTLSAFYLIRQATWATNIAETFQRTSNLSIWTPETGDLVIPQFGGAITIGGRDSRIIPTDLHFGSTQLRYSTAAVLFGTALGEKDFIAFYGEVEQSFEVVFAGLGSLNASEAGGSANVKTFARNGDLVLIFSIPSSPINVAFSIGSLTVLILDTPSAYTVWQPTLAVGDGAFANFAEIGTNSSVVVVGPLLVRNASLDGTTLSLFGDTSKQTSASIYASSDILSVIWNGEVVKHTSTATSIQVQLAGPEGFDFTPPVLASWKMTDSLPELAPSFDDSTFVVADFDADTTNANTPPRTGPVLSATDYGFVTGIIIWRGRFEGDVHSGVTMNLTGGLGFGFSVWVGETFLGSTDSTKVPYASANFTFPAGSLSTNQTNVLTIIQDHMGLDEDTALDKASKNNRGITSISLLGPSSVSFLSWKVQGNQGGEKDFPDRTRGLLNEGGLFGEREGYHLPGFDDSAWNITSSSSIQVSKPGVAFFRTTFELDIDAGFDVALSFEFARLGGKHRALLFVNGWQFGKLAGNVGPQLKFPVPEGILDYSGENTVVVAFWAYGTDPIDLELGDVKLAVGSVVKGGVGKATSNNPGWVARK